LCDVQFTPSSCILKRLVVDALGQLIAATPDGLQFSADGRATFAARSGSPPLYLLAASPDGTRLVGVGSGGQIWT